MKLINAELKKKGIKLNDLSDELKERIESLQYMIKQFNSAYDKWEEGGEDDDTRRGAKL